MPEPAPYDPAGAAASSDRRHGPPHGAAAKEAGRVGAREPPRRRSRSGSTSARRGRSRLRPRGAARRATGGGPGRCLRRASCPCARPAHRSRAPQPAGAGIRALGLVPASLLVAPRPRPEKRRASRRSRSGRPVVLVAAGFPGKVSYALRELLRRRVDDAPPDPPGVTRSTRPSVRNLETQAQTPTALPSPTLRQLTAPTYSTARSPAHPRPAKRARHPHPGR